MGITCYVELVRSGFLFAVLRFRGLLVLVLSCVLAAVVWSERQLLILGLL